MHYSHPKFARPPPVFGGLSPWDENRDFFAPPLITNPISFLAIKNLIQVMHSDKNWRLSDHFAMCRAQKKLLDLGSLRKNVMIQKKLKGTA